ncbi:MAG: LSm family protein [Candidatus Parvarchaeota archaeon]|jgi:small nuclear ribonucleoprotein|nr:LSm family protein [Candidatus Parvarchaeota archaeon]MCL5107035.1 LSm family protein [Candidatus Parvarchaeota archaeon]
MSENVLSRPLDMLNSAKGKMVLVELKNGHAITGKLVAFDVHINVTLENAEEKKDADTLRKLGNVFIRGDTIILISPTI